MSEQSSLWDAPPQRPTFDHWSGFFNDRSPIKAIADSPESVDAGIANMPNRASQERRVLDLLCEQGAMTDAQIADALGVAENSARPRRVRLVEKGLVRKVGTATTSTGRKAALWAAA